MLNKFSCWEYNGFESNYKLVVCWICYCSICTIMLYSALLCYYVFSATYYIVITQSISLCVVIKSIRLFDINMSQWFVSYHCEIWFYWDESLALLFNQNILLLNHMAYSISAIVCTFELSYFAFKTSHWLVSYK